MKTFLYILHSQQLNRFYTGITTLEVEERLENHLAKKYSPLNYTQKANDWEVFFHLVCEDYSQARKIENHIKRMKSYKYIQNLKLYPDISIKLLKKYQSF
ncbi:GIY-YIG nuclease family protein [Litoribacter alkaliphilus]|uniref:GIY-YIG nuclease family protein n=1 Tax=Litoribacter ruber TaxID=702568 RepID=A0AAP2CFU3_9BACT|nr:GIY-YIG nuclease family protein [Litoribacter alkaliphilus]MBS9523232.1 GIY-YIG nuclease family protein [Litoribacter alkaliphilus]